MTNVAGERFYLHKTGYADLLKIPAGGEDLKVLGLIDGSRKCSKKTYILMLNLTGSWLEKKIAMTAFKKEGYSFSLTIDDQEVWAPTIDRNPSLQKNIVFNNEAGKFFVRELESKETNKKLPGVQIHLVSAPKLVLKVTRPLSRASVAPHLNLNVNGLGSPGIQSVGGLLGSDDHSEWSTRSADCQSFARVYEKDIDGSSAEASW